MMAVEEVLKMMEEVEGQGVRRNHGGRFIR